LKVCNVYTRDEQHKSDRCEQDQQKWLDIADNIFLERQQAYARAVWQLAAYYHRSPDQLTDQELRHYFLYLANEKKLARPTTTIALCGIKFFYEQTLQQAWPTLRFVRPPREWKLPVVLSRAEVRRILHEVRIPVYRACLTTIYACGLRLLEGIRLQVPDVDSARMLLHIHLRARRIAMCRCRSRRCNCCALIGAPIAHPSGCFPRPRGTVWPIVWRMMVGQSRAAVPEAPAVQRAGQQARPWYILRHS
jgi:hypothetical protein